MAPLTRLCLAADGRVKAQFADNRILLLSASGTAFIACGSSGDIISRQISQCALARHAPLLAMALEFRNLHVDQPYICSALLQHSGSSSSSSTPALSLGYQLREVFWPACAQQAQAAGLVQALPDAGIALSATDGSARMVLHASQQRFAVCFPLLLRQDSSSGQFLYSWHTQVFSLQDYPSRWHPAVQVLLQVATHINSASQPQQLQQQQQQALEAGQGQLEPGLPGSSCPQPLQLALTLAPTTTSMPAEGAPTLTAPPSSAATGGVYPPLQQHPQHAQHHPQHQQHAQHPQYAQQHPQHQQHAQQQPVLATELPVAAPHGSSSVCEGFPPGSWWFEPTLSLLPSEELLLMEWTPEATHQFLPAVGEVQVWVHASGSCLVTEKHGRFVRHLQPLSEGEPGPPSDSMYASSAVPDMVWAAGPQGGQGKGRRYPLAVLAAHAAKFREQMSAVLAAQAVHALRLGQDSSLGPEDQLANSFAVQSDQVVHATELQRQGSFTAYVDGRVRAAFHDRTIMHLNCEHTHCKVFLPDGASLLVAADNPVGVEGHMQVLLKYARWAFMSEEQHNHAAQLQLLASTSASASGRMAKLLDFNTRNQLPASVGWQQADTRDQGPCHPPESLPPWAAPNAQQAELLWPGAAVLGTAGLVEEVLRRNVELIRKL